MTRSMGGTIYLESTRLKKRVTPRVDVPTPDKAVTGKVELRRASHNRAEMAGTVVIELVPGRAFSRSQSPLINYLRGYTVNSTPLFSSICKIIRTNDVISLNTRTIIIFDKLCNSCYYFV